MSEPRLTQAQKRELWSAYDVSPGELERYVAQLTRTAAMAADEEVQALEEQAYEAHRGMANLRARLAEALAERAEAREELAMWRGQPVSSVQVINTTGVPPGFDPPSAALIQPLDETAEVSDQFADQLDEAVQGEPE